MMEYIFHDGARNALFMYDEAYPDGDPTPFRALTISMRGKYKTVYPIGTYYWTWEEKTRISSSQP